MIYRLSKKHKFVLIGSEKIMPKILTMTACAGMVITGDIIDARGQILLKSGTKLTEKLIPMLVSRGIFEIDILDRFTLDLNPMDSIRHEIIATIGKCIHKYAPDTPEANKTDHMVKVAEDACMIIDKLAEEDAVVNFCTQLKIVSEPLLQHSYTVCSLSMLLAGAMGCDVQEMYKIGCAGLLHDIGLLEMPHLINAQSLSAGDQSLYNEHTTYGYYVAKEHGIDEEIAQMIYTHHEYFDGSGYPRSLTSSWIPIGARILSVVDSFDSLINFQDAKIYQAVEYLYGAGDMYFDLSVVKSFFENISIYPLGSMVRLSNGETGVVVNVRRNLGDRPVIRVFYNSLNRRYSSPKLIDMGQQLTLFVDSVLS